MHQIIVKNLIASIQRYLDQHPAGIVVPGSGVIFTDFSGVIPDIVFISNQRRDEIASGERITSAPNLVIEIVSPGPENDRRDRIVKRQLYGKYGVKEYWIVDPESRTVETYLSEGQALNPASVFGEQDDVTSSVMPGYSCKVESVFSL